MLMRFALYALLILLLFRALGRFLGGLLQGMGAAPRREPRAGRGAQMVRDPVCGTFVLPGSAIAVRDAAGVHHFCSEKCRQTFLGSSRR
jgi:uncharacterized protein